MAYEKVTVICIVQHVEGEGCEQLWMKIVVQEAGEALQQLRCDEPLGKRLAKFDRERFENARNLVEAAIDDVASFDTILLKDIKLQVRLSSLKTRLSHLAVV
ncbi:uncharacterized protein PHACADRAFT_256978 [Phanerochaete carnosa HHB-10118-sp]|uniref:Uncharacterized protein n=1 Tax=Phanerochaete carnosa (strain HHB-10118-sp) TaxID=650164 RepID=K5WAI5_PHACS|nr:uncharacterized protein PHACADRAFT_256978 [Phanerochaete carnosa HHB-10118-sp]EKM55984.1 hypothetical protein PHACADRAFT_256978 [Phanerochaete carnosa HHB-10118-sp]